MIKLSPVVIFCYQRIKKTKLLINSLLKNDESKDTILYIFSDGYIDNSDKFNVKKVRKYISKLKGFKKIIIIERKKNLGLSNNIISGANYIFKKHNKAIFLEDDLLVSKNFLNFMNYSLDFYFSKKEVWHISGWNYNIDISNEKYDGFLWRVMNCWGWATWRDRWKFFIKNPKLITNKWSKKKIKEFNLDNSYNFFSQITRNQENIINTWAVFWYASIFDNKGLCLNPKVSLTKNNGFDEFSSNSFFNDKKNLNFKFTSKKIFKLPILLRENDYVVDQIKTFLKNNFLKRFCQFIKRFFL